MGQGGELTFLGPPAEAKDFFDVSTYDGIYAALDQRPAQDWRREFEEAEAQFVPTHEADVEPDLATTHPPRVRRPNVGRQGALLARRYLKLMVRDRRNLALLLGQVPLIALGIALLFSRDIFVTGRMGAPGKGALLLFLTLTTAIWLGSIDGSREIIKERSVFERERAIGVKLGAYLASKATVLFALVTVQCSILVAVIFVLRPLHESLGTHLLLLGVLSLTGFVAVAMGLLISSIVSSEDQAASFIPLALIPQLLFGGAIVAISEMSGFVKALSVVVFSRWTFAAAGNVVHMNERLAGAKGKEAALDMQRFGESFFGAPLLRPLGVLAVFVMMFLATTAVSLRMRGGDH
jgi:hypothetical protein